jgi:hypothetical protein
MKNNHQPTSPVFATILLALFSSVLCLIAEVVYLVFNWNNQIWTIQVKLFFTAVGLVMLVIVFALGYLYRKITRL